MLIIVTEQPHQHPQQRQHQHQPRYVVSCTEAAIFARYNGIVIATTGSARATTTSDGEAATRVVAASVVAIAQILLAGAVVGAKRGVRFNSIQDLQCA